MIKKIALILFSCLLTVSSQAEAVKDITVSGKEPFTDHVSLKTDSKDMDIIVKFVFDEANEALTVSLISYRSLFVFREDTRYSQVKGRWSSKLKLDQFPYVMAAGEGQSLRLGRAMKMAIPKPRKSYIFHRWINYDGLIPQPAEYQMVNDVIEQKFDIKNKQNNVTVSLRDVFLMELDVKKINTFWMVYGKDLNTRYQITLQRDPCLGKEQEIQEAQQMVADLQKAYLPFAKRYQKGVVSSKESLQLFSETKETLMQQFPSRTVETPCSDLQQQWDEYNAYVDSIASMNCKVVEPQPAVQETAGARKDNPLVKDPTESFLLSRARRIDAMVAEWQITSDQIESSDIEKACRFLINECNAIIKERQLNSPSQIKAVKIFREAEKHFKLVCRY